MFPHLGFRSEANPPPDVVERTQRLMREAQDYLQPAGTYSVYSPTNRSEQSLETWRLCDRGKRRRVLPRRRSHRRVHGDGRERNHAPGRKTRRGGRRICRTSPGRRRFMGAELAAQALITASGRAPRPGGGFHPAVLPRVLRNGAVAAAAIVPPRARRHHRDHLAAVAFMHPLKSMSGLIGLGPRRPWACTFRPASPARWSTAT